MWEWLTALFQAVSGVSKAVEKGLPSEKVADDNHIIKRDRLVLRERDRILEECRLWLSVRPKIDIDTYVDFKCGSLHPLDIEEIKGMLHEMFPHRAERTLKYDKILHDKIDSLNQKK